MARKVSQELLFLERQSLCKCLDCGGLVSHVHGAGASLSDNVITPHEGRREGRWQDGSGSLDSAFSLPAERYWDIIIYIDDDIQIFNGTRTGTTSMCKNALMRFYPTYTYHLKEQMHSLASANAPENLLHLPASLMAAP